MRAIAAPTVVALLVLLLPAAVASGQAPQLLATDPAKPGDEPHPVTLSKADVHLLMAGRLCQTTITLTFSNDADRVLEGELVFPLPENATVSGYALDVGGQLVDAVTIEKEKARVVFETEVRSGIDPGIVEQVRGNNFRTRVHPIPAKGSRTIRVRYVAESVRQGDHLRYRLPVRWPGATPELMVRIESVSARPPTVEGIPGLKFDGDGTRFVAQRNLERATFDADVFATLPDDAAAPRATVEKRTQPTRSAENFDPKVAEQFARTDFYFVLSDSPAPPSFDADRHAKRPVARVGIAWDASLSRAKVDHAKEFELIKAHLARLRNAAVDVVAFRNVPDGVRTFTVTDGDASAILSHLSSLHYDGGTDLSAVAFSNAAADGATVAHHLLFTDGLSNLGAEMPTRVEAPVYAVSVDPRSDHALLRRLSSTSGGQYLNLASLTVEQASAALHDRPLALLSVDHDSEEVADVYPRGAQVVEGGRVTVAGRLLADSAKVTLNYGRDGQVGWRVPVTLTRENAREGGLVPRFWAQLKLADLSAAVDRHEAEITELGKEFDLVTPYTSMIVLETVDQYLRHNIVPPKSRGDVYAQFVNRVEQRQIAARNDERAKIDRIVGMWQKRLAWWDQEFKYPADFRYRAPAKAPAEVPALATRADGAAQAGQAVRGEVRATTGGVAQQPAGGTRGASAPGTADPSPSAAASPPARALEERLAAAPAPRLPAEASANRGLRGFAGPRDETAAEVEFQRAREEEGFLGRDGTRLASSARGRAPASRPGLSSNLFVENPAAVIGIKGWSPDAPYLKALRAAPAHQAYAVYLSERNANESSPAFYLDCADFFAKLAPDLALRILTNIPELAIDDGRLIRIAAHRLQQLGRLDLAIELFEKVARLRPEEPQSFRDLALALADRADAYAAAKDADRARSDYERALQLLHKVVMNPWQRFEEIEVIALTEANRLLARIQSAMGDPQSAIKNPFDARLVKLLDPELRIVLTWDTDNTDIDLHVIEPSGEECFYSHNRTTIGGTVSRDFTQGYGPEEYVLRRLMPGEYKIRARFFGNRDQRLVGPTTVQATIVTRYGRPDEKRESITLRLREAKETVDVGTVTLK